MVAEVSGLHRGEQDGSLPAGKGFPGGRKVILVPGMRLWGMQQIQARQEMRQVFGHLIDAMKDEGVTLEDNPGKAGDMRGDLIARDSDFIAYSYSGREYYHAVDTRQPLEHSALLLGDLFSQVRDLYPCTKVDIVGFSLGGLVAAYWAGALAKAEVLRSVHCLVLVSAPVVGTTRPWLVRLYDWLCPCPVLWEIQPHTPIMRKLGEALELTCAIAVGDGEDWVVNGTVGQGMLSTLVVSPRGAGGGPKGLVASVRSLFGAVPRIGENHRRPLRDPEALTHMMGFLFAPDETVAGATGGILSHEGGKKCRIW